MKILMVYPKYPNTFWSFSHALKFVSKKAAMPPLGLLTIASMLPKDWKIKLIDLNVKELSPKDIRWADMVFISAMIVQRPSVEEIIKLCSKKTIVVGGPLFTTERLDGINHYVLNEAEVTLPLFLDDLEKGSPKKIYSSKVRPLIDETPIPKWSLINLKEYSTIPIQYSRGCPYNCEFCDIVAMNGRVPRTKSTPQLLAELDALHKAGWNQSVFIVDDNFIGNKSKVKEMLRELILWQKKRNYPFKLLTEASTDLASDNELMQLMSAANFYNVFLGIETPDIDSLKECSKYQNTTRDLEESIKLIQGNGMQVMGGFILGFDSDKETIFDAQYKFIQRIGVVTAMVGLLNALPQTRLYYRLKAEKRLINKSNGSIHEINFIPKMDREMLISGYRNLVKKIYTNKRYYKRINTFLKHYKPTVKTHLSISDFKAFLKSIFLIGVFSNARFRYWKLITKTAIIRRKSLPVAVELAIYGQHFRRVAKTI